MFEGFLVAAGSVALGQWIAKWRNAPRTHQPQWPMVIGSYLGRLTARLCGINGRQRRQSGSSLTQQARHISRPLWP